MTVRPSTFATGLIHVDEVILFLGTATAGEDNSHGYPLGEKHAVLLFLRQVKGSAPSWSKATEGLEQKGWSNVSLSDANSISVEALDSVHPHAAASYADALKDGFAALVFSEPVLP